MSISNSKRNFLTGRLSAPHPMRPPWAIIEQQFIETCTRCAECANHCPNKIIRIASGGFPEIDVSLAGCNFCEICVDVCEPNALSLQISEPLNVFASVSDACFSERGVICRSCGEVCESRAIKFQQVVGGVAHVLLDTTSCNGCGECVSLCPAKAITMQHRDVNQ